MRISLGKTIEYLFYGIIFILPWQAVWLWREPFFGGYKWEYGVIGIYGADILIVLFLVLSLVEYCKAYNFKFQISNFKSISNDKIFNFKNFILYTLYLILAWSFISIAWSSDKLLAFYFSFKLFLAIGSFWALRRISFDWKKLIFVLLVAGALQGAMAIGQFLAQETFSSKWLGVAQHVSSEGGASVVENASGRWLRAYGTFPHPNILGGYLAVILLIIVWQETRNKKQDTNKSQISNLKSQEKLVSKCSVFHVLCYMIIFSGLIVSFSRSTWLAFVVGFAILFFTQKEKRKELGKIAIIFAGVALIWISAFSPLFFSRLGGQARLERKSLSDRQEYVMQAKEIISENFWLGVGAGNYTAEAHKKYPERPIWQIQPVHNVFLLIWAELGFVGLILFISTIILTIRKSFKDKLPLLLICLYAYMFFAFDHWLWSSHFGILFFFLIIGIIFKQIKE